MEQNIKSHYVRRTQKNYSMAFKLQIVAEVERGELTIAGAHRKYGIQGSHTVGVWIRKYGILDAEYTIPQKAMKKCQEQRLLELEQKVLLLERQKAVLEKQLEISDKKVLFFDMMIDIAEEEFKIPLRKKFSPEQSIDSLKLTKKQ
jgi:transposase-like protein